MYPRLAIKFRQSLISMSGGTKHLPVGKPGYLPNVSSLSNCCCFQEGAGDSRARLNKTTAFENRQLGVGDRTSQTESAERRGSMKETE